VAEGQVAGGVQGGDRRARAAGGRPFTAVGVVIVVTTALALALRVGGNGDRGRPTARPRLVVTQDNPQHEG
jgi:hypothetical protein